MGHDPHNRGIRSGRDYSGAATCNDKVVAGRAIDDDDDIDYENETQ